MSICAISTDVHEVGVKVGRGGEETGEKGASRKQASDGDMCLCKQEIAP